MSDADLADLMRRAAQHQMTPAERQEQTISLVCGLLPEDSPLTKDDVAKMIYARDGNLAEMEARIEELETENARLREKKGRLNEIVLAIIAGIAFGAIFLFGAWWHGNFFAGLLYIAVGSGFVFLWELVSYAYRWWKSLRQTPNWRREETRDE
jgi:hypothetical protein